MGKIRVLDEQLANQIAAGEVVERPASIVKELVENAIDARADKIIVQLEEGGISYIRVSDNGSGMEREDAVIAFERHATSKIQRERDLFQIQTLGFRGEALPSIASVAKVELKTAEDASELATLLTIEGGQLLHIEDTSRSRGTDVVVRDLFYNTPARLKYLKTVNTEVGQVADVMGRLALSCPDLSFTLIHNGKELFRTPGDGKLLHVIHAIYGKQVASQMMQVGGEDGDFQLSGYISKPELTRSNRSYLSIILNGRYVRSIPISQSILRAYGTLLPNGRYPIGIIQMKMDPKLVDVNVHPTKLEVRLSKERELCQLIEQSVQGVFHKQRLVPQAIGAATIKSAAPKPEQSELSFTPVRTNDWQVQERASLWNDNLQAQKSPSFRSSDQKKDVDFRVEEKKELENVQEQFSPLLYGSQMPDPVEEKIEPALRDIAEQAESLNITTLDESIEATNSRFPLLLPLAQVHGTYIVAQSDDGFYLVDQHAAHERVYYEVFYRRMGEKNSTQQPLLIPLTIECTLSEVKTLENYLEELQDWGLDLEPFGGNTFMIRAYPSWFPKENEVGLIYEIIHYLKDHDKVDVAVLRDASAKMMSCKAAIKANRHLRHEEMESLFQQLSECGNPFTCPHGRPIFVHFTTYELEKMFKRVM
ncbi:DNA mismatch repair protein MutL [Thermoactinomyces sp. DSM 45891]|uniref:DNA mismatch repair endonuclease MutL n=1 Tax=Thermoactinomyces sp. DSM 45891 TaxID=1761907 RepID=UPI0009171479|nr:DNA mismatch repair endonuclease MutL [Thermoactinomyces sp. DSM 45891]SFW99396.1 DNA mismatch repair protein MutL [Thermoactinomyces sp. DSM 45891]